MLGCKYIESNEWCPHGCTQSYTVCHHFSRGKCRWSSASSCRRGFHPKRSVPPPQGDLTRESLKKLGLNEDRENVDRGLVEAVFRHHAKIYHPDKHPSDLGVEKRAAMTATFREMFAAKEHLLTIFPED